MKLGSVIAGAGVGFLAGGPVGALAGGVAAYGTDQQNVANAKEAKKNREFASDQAKRQMDFQERMSSSAHQRQIADMKKAGLNPILSAKTGGASSPGGASGSPSQARFENVLGKLEVAQIQSLIQNTEANTAKTLAEKDLVTNQLPRSETYNKLWDVFNNLFDMGSATAQEVKQKFNEFKKYVESQSKFDGKGFKTPIIINDINDYTKKFKQHRQSQQ